MRLIINLDGGVEVSYDHTYQLYSFIVSAIRKVDQDLASKIHNNSHYPRYCMSQLLPGGKREFGKTSMKAERFIFLVSSLDKEILEKVKSGIEILEKVVIGKSELRLHSITFEHVNITSEIVNMFSRSPIILKENGKYLTPNDENYKTALVNNITSKYMKVKGTVPKIRFLKIISYKSKLMSLKNAKIPASFIKFTISSEYEFIDFIACVGVGSKTQMGYGFVEEERREVNYEF